MNDAIDIYCERLSADFWAEPINAITNAAFIIAGIMAIIVARRHNALNGATLWLAALILMIGTGSFLFHTFATRWAMLTDVIPIMIYKVSFLIIYARRVVKASWPITAGLVAGFFALGYIFGQMPQEWLNGSLSYAPAFLYIGGFGVYHLMTKKNAPWALLAAAVTFAVSLTFRSLDMAMCEAIPMGIHFMWHVLNGVVLYLTLYGLIRNHPPKVHLN